MSDDQADAQAGSVRELRIRYQLWEPSVIVGMSEPETSKIISAGPTNRVVFLRRRIHWLTRPLSHQECMSEEMWIFDVDLDRS